MYQIKQFDRRPSQQCGLSLIELLISLFLSSLMIVALFAFLATVKANAMVQDIVLETQHSVRMATDLIRSEVQKAGFKNDQSVQPTDPFAAAVTPFAASRYVEGSADQLNIRYQSDGLMRDCVGNLVPLDTVVIVSLRLQNSQLSCFSTIGLAPAEQFVILDGVSALKFSYLDDDTSKYVSSANVNRVRGVKFEIEFTEDVDSGSGVSETFLRKYTQVVALRNVF